MIAGRIVLMTIGILVSGILCTLAYGIIVSYTHNWKAIGLPALLHDPLYWLLISLLVGGEIWLGIHKAGGWAR